MPTPITDPSAKPLAVLIDADNASASVIAAVLAEVATYGTASVKRIYGDWTKPNLSGWKDELLKHSIQPIQQFSYTTGKNATDSAMIIDAMDLLYTGRFTGFCLVTSDSDFTRLAARVREQGLTVYGFGEKKTPKPFVHACDSEWASLGGVGSNLSKLMPDFDSRNYGDARLSDLVKAISAFEVLRKDQHILVRAKPKNP